MAANLQYPFGAADSDSNTGSSASFTISDTQTFISFNCTASATTCGLVADTNLKAGATVNILMTGTTASTLTYIGNVQSNTVTVTYQKDMSQQLVYNGTNFYPIASAIATN